VRAQRLQNHNKYITEYKINWEQRFPCLNLFFWGAQLCKFSANNVFFLCVFSMKGVDENVPDWFTIRYLSYFYESGTWFNYHRRYNANTTRHESWSYIWKLHAIYGMQQKPQKKPIKISINFTNIHMTCHAILIFYSV
jgi:hypothetical protein